MRNYTKLYVRLGVDIHFLRFRIMEWICNDERCQSNSIGAKLNRKTCAYMHHCIQIGSSKLVTVASLCVM